MAKWWIVIVVAVILIAAYGLFFGHGGMDVLLGDGSSGGIPDPYYLELRPADVQNPDDVIRYSSSIRRYAADLEIFERAAFYQWYLKSRGFDVSFAYAGSFSGSGLDHLWLLVKNEKGEVIEVDPSYDLVGGSSIVPLDPQYTRYERKFDDIYQAADALGLDRISWWTNDGAWEILNENVLLVEER